MADKTVTITINVPEGRVEDYLEQVLQDVRNGCTSGYWSAETNWTMTDDET